MLTAIEACHSAIWDSLMKNLSPNALSELRAKTKLMQ
jgi:hypothetical protein